MNNMKKITNIIGVLTLLLFASCSDFLDKYPSYAVDPESEVTDDVAKALTTACYKTLQSSNLYNQRIWGLDIIAGNSLVGAGGGTDGIETVQASNFTAQSDNGFALYVWRSPWVGIGRCNIVFTTLPAAEISGEVKTRCMGEAYFLRAHYYYLLVRLYGGVPLRLHPFEPGESTDIARNSVDEVYEQIISDCKNAIAMLPVKGSYSDSDKGRACKEAAMAMLADVYLTLAPNHSGYYSEVVKLCDDITAFGYDLSTCNYDDNFNATIDNGAESLFEVQYSGSTEYDFWGADCQSSWLSTFMGPRNSGLVAGAYGWNLPTEEFVSQYEAGDLRKDVTIFYQGCPVFDGVEYKRSWSNTGYNVRKFLVSKTISPEYNTNPNNFVIYRYADVLLKKAEALNEQGHPDQAAAPLNIVRKRAGLTNVPATLSQADMREKIIHERRMELAFEGHRWFDLIRIDNGNYALKFLKSIGKANVTKERLLLPIPQTEMDSNHLMTQNPGY